MMKFNKSVIFILLTFIFIIIVFLVNNVRQDLRNQTFKLIEESIDEKSINLDKEIQDTFKVLIELSDTVSSKDLSDLKKIASSFDTIVKENGFKRIAIANNNGIAYFNDGIVLDVSDREYFQKGINGSWYISSMTFSQLDGKKTNVFTVPIYKDNNIVGLIIGTILANKFYDRIDLDNLTDLGDSFIINSDGDIIVSHENSIFNSESLNFFDVLKDKDIKLQNKTFDYKAKGYANLKLSNKQNVIIHYSKLKYNDWWAITLVDEDKMREHYSLIINDIYIITTLTVLFMIIGFSVIYDKDKKRFESVKSLAYKDIITGGNNDKYLSENIYKIINDNEKFAFISLEIVNIKNIITMIGLNNAQFIIKEVYTYLSKIINENEVVIHSYLGEYKLLVRYDDIKCLIERIENISLYNINENINFIMGIYLINNLDVSFGDMCSYVSIAKETLNNSNTSKNYMVYSKHTHKREIDKFKLEDDIKKAISDKEFKAWFQPKYGEDGKTIIGAEALARWHKYGSVISPYVFIPICEANGLIKEIDELIFEDVCKNINKWIKNNKKLVPISVNLSRSYIHKINFIENLEKYIYQYKIPRELINFEITESSLIGNENRLKQVVSILHEKGFKVLLDDFGVGYSSIKSISDVDFDTLKIDKSFVDGIGQDKWEHIIKYTIDISKKLGMNVIVEGIETEEQYRFLLECNCNMFQGYYFSKPLNSDEFFDII